MSIGPKVLATLVVVGGSALAQADGVAADYDCRSIEWIVGWGAGGGSDVFARSMAPAAADALDVSVTVLNMPGASSITAMEEVISRDADGCTLFSITPDQLTNELTGLTDLSYRDLVPVMRAHVDIGMIYSAANSDLTSWQDATSHANELIVGGTGAASFDEIVIQVVLDSADVAYRYIPYENASDMHADLIGGRLDLIYDEISVMDPMIKAEQVRPLLTLAEQRIDAFSDVPSAAELDYDVPPSLWRGVAVKTGTSEELVAQLERAFLSAADSEAYQEFESDRLLDLYPGRLGAAEFGALLEHEYEAYERVINLASD